MISRETVDAIRKFTDDRDWKKYHTAENLAKSISIEAAELLEHFQWHNGEITDPSPSDGFLDEVADVAIYLVMLVDLMGFKSMDALIKQKLRKNAIKYPVP